MPVRGRARVVMMVDALADGTAGAQRFAAAPAGALPPERLQTTLCTPRTMEPGRLVSELEDAGVGRLELGRRHTGDVLPFRKLTAFLRGRGVDLLHTHKFGSNLWGTMLGRASGVPVVIAQEHTW